MENFPYIPFEPDRKTLMRRMGSSKANFVEGLEEQINHYIKMSKSLFQVAGKACIYDIKHISEDQISIESHVVKSLLLTKMLKDCQQIYLMCTSIPQVQVNKISEAMLINKGVMAIVLDAYASEYVDGAFDVIVERKNAALKRIGQKLTKRRFSAGYGDLDISYQKVFYDLLDMQTLGVNINDQYLLSPEKSVIAIAGVE